ncbi:DUF3237 domain-containing protein [Leucobacter sp. cx-328]|uniref:DUF3237 domain-containing protein n=1 Tax=unclassified Leucobacter TaxID=2621730 RepID=UPI00165DCDBA|nr:MULTISPECIES: DUF3237 domain-containing protein [unclassified Leucobacter]MBC9944373.1 DUF3237 domain-containing protein [Leucobacter sp. cx-328]
MTTPLLDQLAVPQLTPVFDVCVDLERPLELGSTRAGTRRIIPIVGGTVSNGLDATILSSGADWQRVRADGTLEIDGRYTAHTADGELLYLTATGIRTGPPEVLAALGRGEAVDPAAYYFRTTVSIETGSADLAWLQRSLFVATCVREAATVRYRTYQVS